MKSVKKSKVTIQFFNGAIIDAENTNLRFIEPYRIVFMSKEKEPHKYLIALVFDEELGSPLTIFANTISDETKCSVTKLITTVNENIGI